MGLFILLCLVMVLFILIQPGKGDMGLGSLGGGGQQLFGGSGGQNFFAKATWIMGAVFIVGALSLTILKTNYQEKSRLAGYVAPVQAEQNKVPTQGQPNQAPVKK